VDLAPDGAEELARRSRGTPRTVNRFLARVRDVAEVKGDGRVDAAVAREGLRMLGVDAQGLTEIDRRLLATLRKNGGGPVGLKTLAMTVGETEDTVENVYEAYLVREGLVAKTPQGRRLTPAGFDLLGESPPGAGALFDG
jgi:Holliday junction DNA helicase RuvB